MGEPYWGGADFGNRRLSVCRRAAPLARRRASAGRRRVGYRPRLAIAHSPFEFGVMSMCAAGYLLMNRQWRIPVARSSAGVSSRRSPDGSAKPRGDRQLECFALPVEPLSIRPCPPPSLFKPTRSHRALTRRNSSIIKRSRPCTIVRASGIGCWSVADSTASFSWRRSISRLPVFLLQLRERKFQWVAATLCLFAIADNFYPYFIRTTLPRWHVSSYWWL